MMPWIRRFSILAGALGLAACEGNAPSGGRQYTDLSPREAWLWPDTSRMVIGATRQLLVTAPMEHQAQIASDQLVRDTSGVLWTSTNPKVATVDSTGRVTAVGVGHTTITAGGARSHLSAQIEVFRYPAPLRFASVSASGWGANTVPADYACGITTDGALYCWGTDGGGALGTGQPLDRCVRFLQGVAAGGELRDETFPFRCSAMPVAVSPELRFTSVSVSPWAACAVATDGAAYCWGGDVAGAAGTLGTGRTSASDRPAAVAGGLRWKSIDVAALAACGVTTTGAAYCWGGRSASLVSPRTIGTAPVPVPGRMSWREVIVNARPVDVSTACGVATDGATYCWTLGDSAAPTPAPATQTFVQLQASRGVLCGRTVDGDVTCWSPGNSTATTLGKALHVADMAAHAPCGVTSDGAAYCWENVLMPAPVPIPLSGSPIRRYLRAQSSVNFAFDADGVLYWWDSFPAPSAAHSPAPSFFLAGGAGMVGMFVGSQLPVPVPGQ